MIGLTGGIASGKSTVALRLREKGAFVADADEVSREVMASPEVLDEVREAFSEEVFFEDLMYGQTVVFTGIGSRQNEISKTG